MNKSLLFFLLLIFSFPALSQNITVNTGATATVLVNTLVDPAVTVSAVTQSCKNTQRGTFTNAGSSVGIASGIVLTNGKAVDVAGPNSEGCAAQTANTIVNSNWPISPEADSDLNGLDAGSELYDICKLEFNFSVNADTIQLTYVFGSEEYTQYSKNGTEVNDLFGFFISGNEYATPVNFATIPGTSNYVGIKTINQRACCNTYFVKNCGPALANGSQYNGYTKVLTSKIKIQPNKTYHIKIAIADASDDIIDSGVLLKAASFALAVPINLVSFNAVMENKNSNKIKWTTASENNNKLFEVLRSNDGRDFKVIETIPGVGNSRIIHDYSFVDQHPENGTNYYRLRQVDQNGVYSYSNIVSTNNLQLAKIEQPYPNPAENIVSMNLDLPENSSVVVQIKDLAGKVVREKNGYLNAGHNTLSIPTDDLQKGYYFINVSVDGYIGTAMKLLK